MKLVVKICVAAFSVGPVVVSLALLVGCDGPGEATTTKPIESNILKKLGQANPGQSEASLAKTNAKLKAGKRR